MDFMTNTYTTNVGSVGLTSLLSTTATTTRQVRNVDGTLTNVAPGQIMRSDLGFTASSLTGGAETDNLVPSYNFDSAADGSPGTMPYLWQQDAQGAGGFTRTLDVGDMDDGTGRRYLDLTLSGTADGTSTFIYMETGGVTTPYPSSVHTHSIDVQLRSGSVSGFSLAQAGIEGYNADGSGYVFLGDHNLLNATGTLTTFSRTFTPNRVSLVIWIQFRAPAGTVVNATWRIVEPYVGVEGTSSGTSTETVTAVGDLEALLQGTTGYAFIEIHQIPTHPGQNTSLSGKVISGGAGNAITIAGVNNGSSAKGSNIIAPTGMGGCMGLARIMATWDGTDYRLCLNGGEVITGTALGTRTGNSIIFLAGRATPTSSPRRR
jgi:hypothetical protein